MREILFRAKEKDSRNTGWVFGYYAMVGDKHAIIKKELEKYVAVEHGYELRRGSEIVEVLPQTVSQFTGFYDRNGLKIFEGDILKGTYPDEPFEPSVSYEEVFWNNGWYQAHFGDKSNSDDLMQSCLDEYSEVAGNVWDYPGLLGVKR